jgi:DNA-directed RNA polymerase specialized sigma24 family protein
VPDLLRAHPAAPLDALSDEALVAAARQDRQAFGALYDRYLSPVYRYCYGRLGNREEAEDATSLIFAKALAALPSHRGGAFRSWLFAIAHNVVLAARTPSLEDLAEHHERRRSVQGALAHLPEEQRWVLELRLAGLTGPEIAAVLGRSHLAVRSTQCRALVHLRTLLGVSSAAEEGSHVD